jgi:3-hydroxybutyryl-CoA dehydrogenase
MPGTTFDIIGIIGTGTMGSGIAQVAAMAGFQVLGYDRAPQAWPRAQSSMRDSLGRLAEKQGRPIAWVEEVLGRIEPVEQLSALHPCGLVIEAIHENRKAKSDLLAELWPELRADAIIASNTSTIPVTALAAATDRPDRFAGLHFFNPVPVLPLVELIAGQLTSQATLLKLEAFAVRLGKEVVHCKDRPGFIANRLLLPFINQAINLLDGAVANREDIDRAARLGLAHPLGPLQLADLVGLDILLQALEAMHGELGGASLQPAPLLRRMVEAGHLGRKNGRGFYEY